MKIKLTKVYRNTKDKTGKPLVDRHGREYEKVSIKSIEYGDKWISGFGGQWNLFWREGDTVNVDVTEDSGYLNFRKPDPVKELEKRVKALEDSVFSSKDPRSEIFPNDNPTDYDDQP